MICLDDPPHSPDLNPCDFWLFGVLKNGMKKRLFGDVDEVKEFVCNFWSEGTLGKVYLVFHEWMRQLE
jgi:hypothetical protein